MIGLRILLFCYPFLPFSFCLVLLPLKNTYYSGGWETLEGKRRLRSSLPPRNSQSSKGVGHIVNFPIRGRQQEEELDTGQERVWECRARSIAFRLGGREILVGSLGLAGETELRCEVDRTGAPRGRVLGASAEEIAGAWSPVLSAERPEGNCMSFSALLPEMVTTNPLGMLRRCGENLE